MDDVSDYRYHTISLELNEVAVQLKMLVIALHRHNMLPKSIIERLDNLYRSLEVRFSLEKRFEFHGLPKSSDSCTT